MVNGGYISWVINWKCFLVFIHELGNLMGFSMAYCEAWDKGIKSRDFTNGAKLNYEPASLVGDEVDYAFFNPNSGTECGYNEEYLDILF